MNGSESGRHGQREILEGDGRILEKARLPTRFEISSVVAL